MNRALILHGKPPRERYENPNVPKPHEANWLPWLAAKLGERGIKASIPIFPDPFEPDFERWKEVFEEHDVDEDTAIIGHSAGAEFALHWLSGNNVKLSHLALVAPWRDTKGNYGNFSEYPIDQLLSRRIGRISIFNSLDDSPAIQENVADLRALFPESHYYEFEKHGHFMLGNGMPDETFPELLGELTSVAS